jgi:hypothetical protein
MDVEVFVSGFEVLKPYAHSIAVGIVVVVLTFSLLFWVSYCQNELD